MLEKRIMFKNCVYLLLIICLFSAGLLAKTYDLDAFLSLVEKNSKDLKIAQKDFEMSKAVKKEAWATALPKIFARGNYKRNILENFLYVDFPGMGRQKFKISRNNEYAFNAVLDQTLFSFQVGTALKAARQYENLADNVYEASRQAIVTMAKKGFYQALLLKKVWEVSRVSEENAKDNYENIKQKFDNGLVSEFELLQAEVNWKNQIPKTTEAKKNYEMALINLKNFAGIEDENFELSGQLNVIPDQPESLEVPAILEQRPDFKAMIWEKKMRATNIDAKYAEYYPYLSGSLMYLFSAQSDEWKFENRNNNIIAGITLNIPIYTGGYTSAQVQKARIEYDKSLLKIDKQKENIANEMKNIRLRLNEAQLRIEAAESTLSSAEKAFKIAKVSADNGLITQLELKDARLFHDQARLNYYMAVFDYLNAYLDWEQAAGVVKAD